MGFKRRDFKILEMFKFGNNFEKLNPLGVVFFGAAVLVIFGLIAEVLRIFVWIGGLVLAVFVASFLVKLFNALG